MRESRQTCVKIHSFENHTHLTKRTQQHECMCRQINSRQILVGDSFDSTAKHFSCRYLKFVLLSASSHTKPTSSAPSSNNILRYVYTNTLLDTNQYL